MARRGNREGLIGLPMGAPWQVSALLGCVAYATFRWLISQSRAGNIFLRAIMPLTGLLAWGALLFFGVISLLAFANAKRRQLPASDTANYRQPGMPQPPPQKKSFATPLANPPTIALKCDCTDVDLPKPVPATWTLAALRSLEWKRFELLCAKYYETVAFKAETLPCGPDGGIDVKLFKQDDSMPIAIVQCKAWNSNDVGVKELRELLGVMTHERVQRGIFITAAAYTREAMAFGASNPIQMLDGAAFLAKITELSEEQQKALRDFAFDGDYRTPTCPPCGIKMKRREGKKRAFFGCGNYPRCRRTFGV